MNAISDINKLPGMKHRDFKPCVCCGKGMMHAGGITFFRLRIERFIIDAREVQRAAGMEMMMGGGQAGAVLANVMGPNNDLAKQFEDYSVLVCEPCSMNPDNESYLWSLYDKANKAFIEKTATAPAAVLEGEGGR